MRSDADRDAAQAVDPADIDHDGGRNATHRHRREQACPPATTDAPGLRGKNPDRLVEGGGCDEFELDADDGCGPPYFAGFIARHTFSGVAGMSIDRTPRSARASQIAFTMAGATGGLLTSPAPFAPSGLTSVGVTVRSVSKSGRVEALGIGYVP